MPQITKDEKVLHPELSYKIMGLCFQIQNNLGRFRNEKSYADALEEALKETNVSYKREFRIPISFKGELQGRNIPDFIIEDKVIVDIKAKRLITRDDYFQVKRYLSVSGKELGIIVNFRPKYITSKRVLIRVQYLEHSDTFVD